MAPRWLSALVLAETLMGAMGFGPMASSTPATKQAAFGAARLGAALSSRARISGSVRRLVCPLAVTMGRRRRGAGDQRSRWSTRVASDNPNAPQPEGEDMYLGTGQNRLAKIEALVKRRQSGLIVVLEDPADAMNAGAVLRSCDAFGVTETWFIHNGIREGTSMREHIESGRAFDADSNKLQDASASANRWVTTRTMYSTREAIDALKAEGYLNVATCFTQRSKSLYQCDLAAEKLALWVGNEFAGLSDLAISESDLELFIPMRGMIQSLNLSVAAAVCLNEISRQRSCVGDDARWALSDLVPPCASLLHPFSHECACAHVCMHTCMCEPVRACVFVLSQRNG